ncbi:hypothetical protein [Scytonema sp. HK-05]|uniref:hypothetical protein n=1 Tax=Scytonema sp. HK-05 TaxID=1137095 RepID=UPI000A440160|nr:hypothetical protein [Scytonema sp. HK-05]
MISDAPWALRGERSHLSTPLLSSHWHQICTNCQEGEVWRSPLLLNMNGGS